MRAIVPLMLLAVVTSAAAQDVQTRWISDETAITLRQDKGLESPVAALLVSGTKVQVLEADAPSGYSKIRVGPGREGWVLTRYLSTQPAARERLAKAEAELTGQKALAEKLQAENARLRAVPPAPPSAVAALMPSPTHEEPGSPPADRSEATAMFTGAGLFLVGLLIGLLIPYLPRGPRRAWSQL